MGLSIAYVGKLGVSHSAFLVALFRILFIVSSCMSVNIPKWVAGYFDLSRCCITSCFRLGDSSLFVRVVASFRMYAVMCLR